MSDRSKRHEMGFKDRAGYAETDWVRNYLRTAKSRFAPSSWSGALLIDRPGVAGARPNLAHEQ